MSFLILFSRYKGSSGGGGGAPTSDTPLPVGTRSVKITLTWIGGGTNDGYIDEISLKLNGGSELVTNGDAESGDTSGWTGSLVNNTYVYTTMLSGDQPPTGGLRLFYGSGASTANQAVDVSAYATEIDAQQVTAVFSAWAGGFSNQADRVEILVEAMNGSSAVLKSWTLYGPTNTERSNTTKMLLRSVTLDSASTAYTNTGGTGDRTASITATASVGLLGGGTANHLINGNTSENVAFFNVVSASGHYLSYDFGSARLIDEARWYQPIASAHGTWKWQGSQNGSDWTDIGASFTFNGFTPTSPFYFTTLYANKTAYRHYRLLGVSGSTTNPFLREIEFRISA